ncbi:hypothetical protein GCM10027614_65610 [Micromonospora vulcania]
MARERATALLLDLDGVLRRFDPAVAAGVEREYGLADGVLTEIAMQWGRLQPVLTGQVNHAEWVSSVADALAEPAGGPERPVRRWSSGSATAARWTPRCSTSSGRYAPPGSRSVWPPTPPTCSTPTWPHSG